jgi:Holliday junction resolvase RusA-like endonuclease
MINLSINNWKIPSDNEKYSLRKNRKTGRYFIGNSKNYTDIKKAMITNFKAQSKGQTISGHFSMTIHMCTYKDMTNLFKIIMDSIEGAGIIDNDRDLVSLKAVKKPEKKGSREVIKITLEAVIG